MIDPSTLDNGTLTATGDHALFQGALALPSLQRAAAEVCAKVRIAMDNSSDNPVEFLITADPDLTGKDTILHGVRSDLTLLTDTVADALSAVKPTPSATSGVETAAVGGTAIAGAFASAVPAVLNLFSTTKTTTSFTTTIEDIHILTAVAHQFQDAETIHIDGFRTIDQSHPILVEFDRLRTDHATLAGHNAVLASQVAEQTAREQTQQTSIATLQKDRAAATSEDAAHQVDKQIDDALRQLDALQRRGDTLRENSAMLDKLVADVTAFIAAVTTPGADGRTLLTTAVLQDWLHQATPGPTRYVLYVKLFGATADQLTLDGKFVSRDKIGVRNDTALTFILVDADGTIVRADTVSATAALLQNPTDYFADTEGH